MEKWKHRTAYTPDEVIVQKLLEGETALFEILIRRYNPLLYKIARSYGFNHQDAEDLMQESHFAAYSGMKSFRKEASYKTWLTKIHLNQCYHKMNSGHKKYESPADEITDQSMVMHTSVGKTDTEKRVLNKELATLLEDSLQRLPLPYRNVFVLREIEGFSVAETADLLELTPVNVKVRLNRAKAMLQKQLENYYSTADIYDFHLMYCDKIVQHVFERIAAADNE